MPNDFRVRAEIAALVYAFTKATSLTLVRNLHDVSKRNVTSSVPGRGWGKGSSEGTFKTFTAYE